MKSQEEIAGWAFCIWVMQGLDWLLTRTALNLGATEANPLLQSIDIGGWAGGILKIGGSAVILSVLTLRYWDTRPTQRLLPWTALVYALTVLWGITAVLVLLVQMASA